SIRFASASHYSINSKNRALAFGSSAFLACSKHFSALRRCSAALNVITRLAATSARIPRLGFVHPVALTAGGRQHFLDRLPETERAVGDREFGAIASPRRFRSRSNSRQDCALSRTPSLRPTGSFLPSGVAPMMTSRHCASFSSLACTLMPWRAVLRDGK